MSRGRATVFRHGRRGGLGQANRSHHPLSGAVSLVAAPPGSKCRECLAVAVPTPSDRPGRRALARRGITSAYMMRHLPDCTAITESDAS